MSAIPPAFSGYFRDHFHISLPSGFVITPRALDPFAERTLTRWLHKPRRKPLVVRGARQVGKSTLIRQFASWRKLRLFEVNLERHFSLAKVMAQANDKVFKLYNLDLSFFNRATGLNHLREEEMLDRRFVNEGKLAEQFVARQLYFSDTPQRAPELHYWLREERAGNAEVDFLEATGGAVLPMEVKSGKGGALKSLIQFAALKNCQLACRLDLNTLSRQRLRHRLGAKEVAFDLILLPLYLCGQIKRLAELHRQFSRFRRSSSSA